jgi:hypothetical protein
VSFIDVKSQRVVHEEQFKFEVNEIAFNPDSNLFFLTNGQVTMSCFVPGWDSTRMMKKSGGGIRLII